MEGKFSTTFAAVLGWLSATAVVGMILMFTAYPLARSLLASGRVEYCYATTTSYSNPTASNVVTYHLWGFRDWREDRLLAQNLKSVDEVKAAAATYGCELR